MFYHNRPSFRDTEAGGGKLEEIFSGGMLVSRSNDEDSCGENKPGNAEEVTYSQVATRPLNRRGASK
jgi:hypothetical protein